MEEERRIQHELHVSGLEGGSLSEILYFSLLPCILSLFSCSFGEKQSLFVQCFLFILPLVLLFSLLSDSSFFPLGLFGVSLVKVLGFWFYRRERTREKAREREEREEGGGGEEKERGGRKKVLKFVMYLNVTIVMLTVFSILGVDFHVFPRRFAKRESFGFSLMDLGVGQFVFKSGFLSGFQKTRSSSFSPNKGWIFSSLSLFLLGLIRFLTLKSTNYQQHTSEYGYHWNFFWTLFSLRLLSLPLSSLGGKECGILGGLVLVLYQFVLSVFGGTEYLLRERGKGEREGEMSLLEMNKEGVFSLFGYFAMFCFAVSCGSYFAAYFGGRESEKENKKKREKERFSVRPFVIKWGFVSVFFWVLTFLCDNYVQNASRRFCNASYVFEMVSFYSFSLLGCFVVEWFLSYCSSSSSSPSSDLFFQIINKRSLFAFLIGNLLTGLTNLTIDTLQVDDFSAFLILLGYVFVVCLACFVVEKVS